MLTTEFAMRSIKQGREPSELRKWKKQNALLPQGQAYPPPSEILSEVKNALYKDQLGLCAYTLRKLTHPGDGHVEHIEPQNQNPEKALDYANMALCFPPNGGDTSYGYGAPVKGGRPVQLGVDFVSPHGKGCEKRFAYKSSGEVQSMKNDAAAKKSIDLLKLNCAQLIDLRLAAIVAQGLTLRKGRASRRPVHPCSVAQAKRLAQEILRPDRAGQLEEFCVAIHQVAMQYAKEESARSKAISAARKKS